MIIDHPRQVALLLRGRWRRRAAVGSVGAIALACALAAASGASAEVQYRVRYAPAPKQPETERLSKEPFGQIPAGPVQIIISVDQQKLHLYGDGQHVEDTPVATGVPDHPTPMGAFSIIEKSRYHHSNIYSGAPMPFMQRITWSGVAIHEGGNLGHPASHGCIRISHDFAMRLFVLTRLGARVIIARPELRPEEFADPHLFVHKDAQVARAAAAMPLKTAQQTDESKTTDAPDRPGDAPKNAAAAPDNRNTDGQPPAASADADKPPEPVAARKEDRAAPAVTVTLAAAPPGTANATATPPAVAPVPVPLPPLKPGEIARASKLPISIFVSRKEKKIYVRQNFSPLFNAPVTIEQPDQRLGTHVFTALEYLDDHSTFRWNVVSFPGEPPPELRISEKEKKPAVGTRKDGNTVKPATDLPPPQTPQQALARVDIPQDAIDRISQMIVPGSSLIVSDQGLGEETGEGTDFIVAAPGEVRTAASITRRPRQSAYVRSGPAYWLESPWH